MAISSSDPLAIYYYNNALHLHNVEKNFQGSIDLLNQALAYDSNYGKAYVNRGSSYYQLGYYQQALTDYTKAISVAPDFAPAYNFKGVLLWQMGNKEEGRKLIAKAFELDPNDKEIQNNFSTIRMQTN